MVYLYIGKKIRLFVRGFWFLECGQYYWFLHFDRLWVGADRLEIQKFEKKKKFVTFGQTKCIFATTKVVALISQNIRKINFLIQNHWSVNAETRSRAQIACYKLRGYLSPLMLKEHFTTVWKFRNSRVTGWQKLFCSYKSFLIFGGRCDRYFWDIRMKIFMLPNFNMLF